MRELQVDWAGLHSAFQMNMPEVKCFLSLEDGRVLKFLPGDPNLAKVRADAQRYVAIEAVPSRIQYQWLDEFIAGIEEPALRERMLAAINGKGAFRRFKDILLTLPDERRRWFEHRDQMMRQRIIEWVYEQGVMPGNEAPWADEVKDLVSRSPLADAGFPAAPGIDPAVPTASAAPAVPAAGTIASAGTSQMTPPSLLPTVSRGGAVGGANSPQDIEALRDFLIHWADDHGVELTPIVLEELAQDIGKSFRVTSAQAETPPAPYALGSKL